MNRTLVLSIAAFLMLVGITLMGGSREAVAGHGCHGCHGCYGCYASCSCSCSCYCSCYSSCYCQGRHWHRRHFRRAYRHAWRHCYGCHGCHGCHVSCHGCYGCSAYYGCSCSCSCSGTVVEDYQEAPAEEAAPVEGVSASTGALRVRVPAEAKVYINDRETSTTGTNRRYVSRGLDRDTSYAYTVRAELNGQVETRTVSLQAGRSAQVAFNFEEDRPLVAATTQTRLTVNVPADAQITLAGNETVSEGATRTFTTTRLSNGQEWNDYTVVASIVRDGDTVTKEQTIVLRGGEDRELSFDFADERVAQLAK